MNEEFAVIKIKGKKAYLMACYRPLINRGNL